MSYKKYLQAFDLTSVILLITVLLLGIFFRFANLDYKVFWVDEVSTAVRVSGYTIPEVTDDLIQQGIVDRRILSSYQTVNSAKSWQDSFNALIQSPEHAPLYFVLTRLWMQWWGNSIVAIRSLSAWLSLLVFPCLYWLCKELFDQPLVSQLAIMFMSVSPFYAAYAQEARPYSLWTVTILLISVSFLRAIRLNNKLSWLFYSFCLTISFYTSLFSIYIAFFQGIYLLLVHRQRKLKIIKSYVISSIIALLFFSPWILVIFNNFNLLKKNTSWMRGNFNLADIIAVFIGTNLLVFGDLPISQNSNPVQTAVVLIIVVLGLLASLKLHRRWKQRLVKLALLLTASSSILLLSQYIYLDWITIIGALVALCILSLSVYSLYYLIAHTNRDRWLFILSLMLSLPVPLVLTDIINQGQSSTAPRYLIPLQLGILIAVTYTLANKLATIDVKSVNQQKFWRLIVIAFISLGIYSCIRNLSLSPFYQKGRNINNPAIAKIINQSNSALVTTEYNGAMDAVSLAYSLIEKVKYKIITPEEKLNQYFNQFDDIYVLKPSLELKEKLENNQTINFNQVYKSHVFSADEFPLDLYIVELAT
ncbi:MAG TPA: glycosyltransferase family 39 protein [Coleofasciculaceae cyanobacterium]|jgi:uncharacterized membrane protein